MSDVYVVTEGSYSDYRVRAVVATQELADELIRQRAGDESFKATILTEAPVKATRLTMTCRTFDGVTLGGHIFGGGGSSAVPAWTVSEYEIDHWPDLDDWTPPKCKAARISQGARGDLLKVEGTDTVRVRKVFFDLRSQAMAEAAGIADV